MKEHSLDVYASVQLKLPRPNYIVFYNGEEDQPDRKELGLSDAFPDDGRGSHLEVKAIMLNINLTHNQRLMEHCRKLYEYAVFIDTIRQNRNGA